MIRFGLRLAVASGREALTRLLIITAAVALGVGLLLGTLAGVNAVNAQNARYGWLYSGGVEQGVGPHAVWWLVRYDYYGGHEIGRVDAAPAGPQAPVPPGVPRLPGPGEYYASPAMARLLASTPAGQLGDRYPGHLIGTIGRAGVPASDSLVILVGRTPDEMAHLPGAVRIDRLQTSAGGSRADGLKLILAVVAAALLFPVLIFIGAATRLAAARREQRFAAMRLVGATPRQVSVISAVESAAGALAGTVLGFGLFALLRHPLAAIPFTGTRFYPQDMSLNALDVVLVGLGVPVAAAAAARLALRRVRISPLGVTRRVTPRQPRAYRLVPLLIGLGELGYLVGHRPQTTNGQTAGYLSGILITMAGLVLAGPWLTMAGARLMASRSRRPAALIAARRLADNPKGGFRAISGPVLALFVTSVAVGVITTIVAHRGTDNPANNTVISAQFGDRDGPVEVPDRLLADLGATPGTRAVLAFRANPDWQRLNSPPSLVSCADLARAPMFGRCPAGAEVAQAGMIMTVPSGTRLDPVWPAAAVSAQQLRQLPVTMLSVATDGSSTVLERVRTRLEIAYPDLLGPPGTENDWRLETTQTMTGWQRLAFVVVLASLPIAGCSLAVSVAGGLAERKRPFSLLRLSGVPLRMLRRVVALESAVPLLFAAGVAVGAGMLVAHLFLRSQMQYNLASPGLGYYAVVLAGIAVSLGIIGATLPLLERITGPETARNE